jgi:hypothetical protein
MDKKINLLVFNLHIILVIFLFILLIKIIFSYIFCLYFILLIKIFNKDMRIQFVDFQVEMIL